MVDRSSHPRSREIEPGVHRETDHLSEAAERGFARWALPPVWEPSEINIPASASSTPNPPEAPDRRDRRLGLPLWAQAPASLGAIYAHSLARAPEVHLKEGPSFSAGPRDEVGHLACSSAG